MDFSKKCIYFLLVENQDCKFEIGKKRKAHFLQSSMYINTIKNYYKLICIFLLDSLNFLTTIYTLKALIDFALK